MIRSQGRKTIHGSQCLQKCWPTHHILEPLLYRLISTERHSDNRPPRLALRRQSDNPSSSTARKTPSERNGLSRASLSPGKLPNKRLSQKKNDEAVPPNRLLTPYNLAMQLKRMCSEGNYDDAVERLKTTPRDAQNVKVWNTMISHCLAAKRYSLAYDLFTDMKRRGFSPNTVTFSTMFNGLSHITSWSTHTKQLANAHSLYEYFLKHIESVKYHEPDDTQELNPQPIAIYMKILGAAGEYQKIFDVYFAMDQEGPLAPNKYIFTAMFSAISSREAGSKVDRTSSMSMKAASDAKHVWMQMEKVMQKTSHFDLDPVLISTAIRAFTHGRPNDQNFAFEIVKDHLGLAKPGEPVPRGLSKNLNSWTLDAVLQLCNVMQKHRLCIHFVRQVMDKVSFEKPWMRDLLDIHHVNRLLNAYVGLANLGSLDESSQALEALEWALKNDAIYTMPKLAPTVQTYHLVLTTCWRSAHWAGAIRTFELMTGIMTDGFFENEGKISPVTERRPNGKTFYADVETMSYIVRTALATANSSDMRQAMWLTEHVGVDYLLRVQDNTSHFHRAKFCSALVEVIDRLLSPDAEKVDAERRQHWRAWKAQALEIARSSKGSPTPQAEEQVLGSAGAVKSMDDFVGFQMATRSAQPRKK
ncbi:hypothetical protein BJ138DRAFT_1079755 [Hygrophoropsis aurantiaca]|uniref:Uncharacterized protein n=1 Tax=Hygrophoropsis aurantiaca TaxID=72124 RepID=A0ACB8AN51_9AGAM|nr:hypothetical protein BJ138DRAFT_1079755 [Hygrophoropsis aurantiaca]